MSEDIQPIKKKIELEVELDTTTKEKKENRFEALMEFADVLDAYRIFPRAFIGVYLYILIVTIQWFMTLPEPNTAQAGLMSVVVGAGAAWFGLYTASGSARNPKKITVGK
jgi:hypothetical protein